MPFCSHCGTPVDSSFCPKCGAATAAAGSAGAAAPITAGVLQTNIASALCYALGLVSGILFLVIAPYNQNRAVRFHAFQSIFAHLAWIVLWIGYSIITVALPLFLHALAALFSTVIGLGGFLLWVVLMWKAYKDEKLVLPIVGPIAEQQAGQ